MELSFILTAARRRWGLIALAILVGLGVALTLEAPSGEEHASEALVLVASPDTGEQASSENLDRFIAAELTVLRSPALGSRVAEAVGAEGADRLRQAATFEQVPGTNLIRIEATHPEPERARLIADTYAEVYVERATAPAEAALDEELRLVNERIAEVLGEIRELDSQLRSAIEPWVARQGESNPPAIPDPSLLVPEASTQHQLSVNEYNQLLVRRRQLEEEQRRFAGSSLVQPATEPRPVPVESTLPVQGAVVAVAALLGLSLALLTTRLPDRVLQDEDVERVLGHHIAGRLPRARPALRSPLAALTLTGPHREAERELGAQVDRATPADGALVVVVAGAQARAGTTTLALTLGRRFAEDGRETVVVDGDQDNPWLTEALTPGDTAASRHLRRGSDDVAPLVPTEVDRLSVLVGPEAGQVPLRRGRAADLVAMLARRAAVIIIDVGHAVPSPLADEVAASAHAVVLAVPLGRAGRQRLREVGWALSDRPDARLLPVTTNTSRRRAVTPPADTDRDAATVDLTHEAPRAHHRRHQVGSGQEPAAR